MQVRTFMSQWNTAVPVTMPSLVLEIHFQNTTCSGISTDFSFCFASRLKICRLSPWPAVLAAFSAMILSTGFMSAESAVMGRFIGLLGLARSTTMTLLEAPTSRTQMLFSDSIVTFVNVTFCELTPASESCKQRDTGVEKSLQFGQA